MATHSRRLKSRSLLVGALAAASLMVGAVSANAAVTLDWTAANVYVGSCSTNKVNCTWLGYLTGNAANGTPAGAGGTSTASDGATGATVDTLSARGTSALYTTSFPAVSGSIDDGPAAEAEGTLQFDGKLTFTGTAHGFVMTFEDPKIVLNGDGTGQLFASGTNSSNAAYDTTSAVFNLDLDGQAPNASGSTPGEIAGWPAAKWVLNWDGSRTLTGIVPSIANTGYAFPANYTSTTTSGLERTPNTFGGFAVNIAPNSGPAGSNGTNGADGAVGPQGPIGPAGPAGKDGKDATVKTIKLKKAIFGAKKVVAKVTKKGKFVGYAEIKGKRAKITYVTASLTGTYKFTTVTGKKRSASVKLG